MKLNFALILFTFLFIEYVNSQTVIGNYSINQSNTSYVEINTSSPGYGVSHTLILGQASSGNVYSPTKLAKNIPLPFVFTFNEFCYSTVDIDRNGFIVFGSSMTNSNSFGSDVIESAVLDNQSLLVAALAYNFDAKHSSSRQILFSQH